MTGKSEDSEWQKLSWAEKVRICQQGMAHEDSLLISYVVIFVGVEAIFAAVVVSSLLSPGFDIAIAGLGMALAINFMLVCKQRGDTIDRWGAIFYTLWSKVPSDEELNKNEDLSKVSGKALIKAEAIAKDYEGCVERLKGGWKVIIFGYSPCCEALKFWLKSARRLTILFTPILVIIMWVFTLC